MYCIIKAAISTILKFINMQITQLLLSYSIYMHNSSLEMDIKIQTWMLVCKNRVCKHGDIKTTWNKSGGFERLLFDSQEAPAHR